MVELNSKMAIVESATLGNPVEAFISMAFEMTKEELWQIAFKLNGEVAQLRLANNSLQGQLAQANERIALLEAQVVLPPKTAKNSSIPPAVSHKSRCEK